MCSRTSLFCQPPAGDGEAALGMSARSVRSVLDGVERHREFERFVGNEECVEFVGCLDPS